LLEFLAYAGDFTGLVFNTLAEFNQDITAWLGNCNNGLCEFEEFNCETFCVPPIQFPPYVFDNRGRRPQA